MYALVGVMIATGIGDRLASAPRHLRTAQQRRLPKPPVDAVTVGIVRDPSNVGLAHCKTRPAEVWPLGRAVGTRNMSGGDAVDPSRGPTGKTHRHLQEREAFVEIDCEFDIDAWLALAKADGPSHAGVAQPRVHANPSAEWTAFLHLPATAAKPRLDRLVPAIGMKGPCIRAVMTKMQPDAATTEHVHASKRDPGDAAGA